MTPSPDAFWIAANICAAAYVLCPADRVRWPFAVMMLAYMAGWLGWI